MERGSLEDVVDVGPGLWIWRVRHPHWKRGDDWDPVVTTTVVESRGEVIVIDPLAPSDAGGAVWQRLGRCSSNAARRAKAGPCAGRGLVS